MPETFDSKDDKKTANPVPHAQLSRMIEQGRSFSGKETNCVYLNTGNNGLFTDVSFSSGLDHELYSLNVHGCAGCCEDETGSGDTSELTSENDDGGECCNACEECCNACEKCCDVCDELCSICTGDPVHNHHQSSS